MREQEGLPGQACYDFGMMGLIQNQARHDFGISQYNSRLLNLYLANPTLLKNPGFMLAEPSSTKAHC